MASPILINAVAKELLLPGNIEELKTFYGGLLDKATDRDAKRRYGRVLDLIDQHEKKAARVATDTAHAKPTTAAAKGGVQK